MSRILITGGCGFLGHHIVEHVLRTTDHDVVVLDKMTYASSGMDRLRDIDAFDGKRVDVLGCDLSHPVPLGIDREIGDVEYVIHAAAETHVDRSITDPEPFITSNVMGTHNLLWWASSRNLHAPQIQRILMVSTDEVYGPAAWDAPGNVETDPFRPANPYAAAKAGAEALGFAYANTYKLPITIVNTMNLIGERQHWEKFVPLVIRSAMLDREVLIHADPTLTLSGTRFYLHARNYAAALLWIIERDRFVRGATPPLSSGGTNASPIPSKLHVAGELEYSNHDLAHLIAQYVGRPLRTRLVDFHSSRPGHDLRYALDDSLIRSMGWVQPVNLVASIERTVRWYLAHPGWLGM